MIVNVNADLQQGNLAMFVDRAAYVSSVIFVSDIVYDPDLISGYTLFQ